jgi:hypothetical protein
MRVYVYWNLHKHLFSVKDTRTGRVTDHARMVVIQDATFAVSQAGRARVLRERRKNVHAGVRGTPTWIDTAPADLQMTGWTRITYNPYKYDSFVRASDERPVTGADEVRLVIRNGRARIFARGIQFADQAKQAA